MVDNGDGTITDSSSNLMWQAEDDGIERDQGEAFRYCSGLTHASFSDWRLPTLEEFNSLLASTKRAGVIGNYNTVYNRTTNADYWTASPGPQGNVAFIAEGTTMFKTNKYCVRAVRSLH